MQRRAGPKVTSFDVARRAGVSQPTVSRALRNLPGTSAATRDRVLEAARELAYVASDSGRSLSTRSTRRVAVVSDELTNPFYPELVEPLRHELAAHGYRTVLVTDTGGRDCGTIDTDALADGSYDGVVLTTTSRRSTVPRDLSELGIPHVLVNRVLDRPESPSCSMDNRGGSVLVADLIAGLGHRTVAAIQGPVTTSTGRERAKALRDRLRVHGIRVPRAHFLRTDYTHDAAREAALSLLRAAERPTAIVCGNDIMALGVLSAAHELGIAVPRDLTVIGFDDIAIAGWPAVGLTTVRCDLRELARISVACLVAAMADVDQMSAPEERRVPVGLALRETHAAPGPR